MIEICLIMFCVLFLYTLIGAGLAFIGGRKARVLQTVPADTFPISHWPSVSVLVPAWRESGTIDRCIECLKNVEYPESHFILIAGGPDGTFERATELTRDLPHFSVVRQSGKGKNAALADGLATATGKVIVVLDADSVVGPEWLYALIRPVAAGEASATCGNFIPLNRTWVSQAEQMEKVLNFQVKQHCVLQGSASIAVTRDVLDQAGGFPADVLVGVDWDLDCRLHEIHCRKQFVADAAVQTHRVADLRQFWRNEVRWRRGLFRVLRRHGTSLFDLSRFRWYWVAVAYAALLLTVLLLAIMRPMDAIWPAIIWGAMTLAIIGRRARIAAAATGFSGDLSSLRYWWAPGILQLLALLATIVSLATLSRISPLFKGPRPVVQGAIS